MKAGAGELANVWFEAWSAMDVERLRSILAPEFVHVSPLGTFEGRDRYLEVVEPLARASVAELTVHETVAVDGLAIVRYTNRTPEGPVEACDWIRVEDGRITEIRSIYDDSLVRRSLGEDSSY